MLDAEQSDVLMRIFHILAGSLALVAGPGAMLTRKGALAHRRWGKLYFWAMAAIFVSGLAMSLMHGLTFLFMVGVFSFYLSFSGYRALYARKPGLSASSMDYAAAACAMFAAFGLLVWAAGQTLDWRMVASVFGGILGILVLADFYHFARPSSDRMAWRYVHMIRMLAAYIATATAFMVVNLSSLPPLVIWLAPTLAGSIGITAWVTYYKVQDAIKNAATSPSLPDPG